MVRYFFIVTFVVAYTSVSGQFVIKPGSSVSITGNSDLYVDTWMTLYSNSTGSGHLADQTSGGSLTVNQSVTVQRYIGSAGWHNVSVPVSAATTTLFPNTDLIFYYNETKIQNDWNFGWIWYPNGNLSVFKGYDIYYESGGQNISYSASSSSQLNTAYYSIGITNTDVANGETENHKGWNLVGNPYPSPVDWLSTSGWNKSDINDAKYIWNPSADNYTIFLGGSAPVGINGGTQYIPSNQGFWIQALNNGNFAISNACRRGIMQSTPDYYKSVNTEQCNIFLKIEANDLSDETLIRFLPDATNGFDRNMDACKLFSPSEKCPQICSSTPASSLAINSLEKIEDDLKIPLEIRPNSKLFSIYLDDESSLNGINKLGLYDINNKSFYELKKSAKLYFSNIADYHNFILIINPLSEKFNIRPLSNISINCDGKAIYIVKSIDESAILKLFNIQGQKVFDEEITEKSSQISPVLKSGIYIAKISRTHETITKKLYIK